MKKNLDLEEDLVVAKFMGFEQTNLGWFEEKMLLPNYIYGMNGGNFFDELHFRHSWDWLIPVLNRIEYHESIVCYELSADVLYIHNNEGSDWKAHFLISSPEYTFMEMCYNLCVEIIKYLNNKDNEKKT